MDEETRILRLEFTMVNAIKFLGLELRERDRNGVLCGVCPRCKSDTLVVILGKRNDFNCFGGMVYGDEIELIAHVKGISRKSAVRLFMAHFTFPHHLIKQIGELRAALLNVIDDKTVNRDTRELTQAFHAACMSYQRSLKAIKDT